MRTPLVLLSAAALAVTLAAPGAAQESPRPEVCPNVASHVTKEQMQGPPGVAVTRHWYSDVQPARTPDGWTLTRVSPAPVTLLETLPAAPSATFTVTAHETSTYRVTALGPDDCPDASADSTRTVVAPDEPSPTPSPSAPYSASCPGIVAVVVRPEVATSGQAVSVEVQLSSPTSFNEVTLTRDDPAPVPEVRRSSADLLASFSVRLGESHRFTARVTRTDRPDCSETGRPSAVPFLVPVRPVVTLAARRDASRLYVFSGRVQPAYGEVALHRVTADGTRVLAATAPVAADGTYRVQRRFTGSGRYGFVAVASPGSTGRHVGGESAVRATVIH